MVAHKIATVGGPKCPGIHPGTPLLRTGDQRIWQCPISKALFEVETVEDESETEQKVDKFGNKMTTYQIVGED